VELENASSHQRYSMMTATHVSDVLALLLGRLLGFPKTLKNIATTENAYSVSTWLTKSAILSNTFQPDSQPYTPATVDGFQSIEALLDTPVISRALFGPRLASHFQIDKNNWRVTPVLAIGDIKAQDVAGLPGGTYQWPSFGADRLGSFLTEHKWKADWPSIV